MVNIEKTCNAYREKTRVATTEVTQQKLALTIRATGHRKRLQNSFCDNLFHSLTLENIRRVLINNKANENRPPLILSHASVFSTDIPFATFRSFRGYRSLMIDQLTIKCV